MLCVYIPILYCTYSYDRYVVSYPSCYDGAFWDTSMTKNTLKKKHIWNEPAGLVTIVPVPKGDTSKGVLCPGSRCHHSKKWWLIWNDDKPLLYKRSGLLPPPDAATFRSAVALEERLEPNIWWLLGIKNGETRKSTYKKNGGQGLLYTYGSTLQHQPRSSCCCCQR